MFRVLLPIALAGGLLFFGYIAYQDAKPAAKEKRIYEELKPFIPYTLQKRVGGLSIVNRLNDNVEKPPASQVYRRLDQLEKMWGKEHLIVEGDELIVLDSNKKILKKISINSDKEREYIRDFFGL